MIINTRNIEPAAPITVNKVRLILVQAEFNIFSIISKTDAVMDIQTNDGRTINRYISSCMALSKGKTKMDEKPTKTNKAAKEKGNIL